MKNKEDIINARHGKANPFCVPEGYFDNLTQQIMERLPEHHEKPQAKEVSLRKFMRPLAYAASLIVAVFTVTTLINQNNMDDSENMMQMSASNANADTYSDDIVDYIMIDNMDIYACLDNDAI